MASLGTLSVNIGANTKDLQRGFKVSLDSTRSFAKEVTSIFGGIQMSQMFSSMLNSTKSLARSVIELAANAELAETQFGVLLQDADKGKKLFAQLDKFTLRTSFSMDAAAQAATLLLAKGTGEADVIPTMSMLGDLTMGNVEKLQLLAKAYSDVQAKGFLMAQETMQFAENGVNLFDLLTKTTGKTVGELLKMRETGQITFAMVQGALQAATQKGGQFYGALEKGNKTFYGQMGQLIKSIQVLGRSLGNLVLPELSKMVTKANAILQTFIAMPEKVKFLGDVFTASVQVAFAYIEQEWPKLLARLAQTTADAFNSLNAASFFTGLQGVIDAMDALQQQQNQGGVPGMLPLAAAQAKLDELLNRLRPPQLPIDPNKVKPLGGPPAKAEEVITMSLADFIGNMRANATPIIDSLNTFMGGALLRAQMAVAPLFAGKATAKSMDPRNEFAGAVQQGTAEAYAAIAAALKQETDPVVEATEQQTNKLLEPLGVMANALKNGLVQKVVGNLLD